jgi:Phage integrase family
VIRHGTAMALLQGGVDVAEIALWLGHESIETTNAYVHANLAMKEKALEKVMPMDTPFRRFHASDRLLRFWSRSEPLGTAVLNDARCGSQFADHILCWIFGCKSLRRLPAMDIGWSSERPWKCSDGLYRGSCDTHTCSERVVGMAVRSK